MDSKHPHTGEEGITTIFVVMLMIAISVVIVVIADNSRRNSEASKQFTQRMEGAEGAESAARSIQYAFTTGVVNADTDDYDITAAELSEIVASENGAVVAQSLSAYQESEYANFPIVSIPGASADAPATLWQIVGIIQPDPAGIQNTNLVLFVRSWKQIVSTSSTPEQRNASATRPQFKRIEMRQGSLADYQILSDAPIQLESNAIIQGRIHSNGFSDRIQKPPATFPAARIWQRGYSASSPQVSCQGVTGSVHKITPSLTTGTGDIKVNVGPECDVSANTNKFVDLAKAADSLSKLGDPCGGGTPPTGVVYHCNGSNTGSGISTGPLDFAGRTSYVVDLNSTVISSSTRKVTHVFDGDTMVSGTAPAGRISIVTVKSAAANAPAPPDIVITGNVNHGSRSLVPASNVGLISSGNIVIRPSGVGCDGMGMNGRRDVNAALMAMSGTVTIPTEFTSQVKPPGALPLCFGLAIKGSVASHLGMSLLWKWGSSQAGFMVREIRWDETLGRTPPPYYPLGDPWEITDIRNANMDCATTREWKLEC